MKPELLHCQQSPLRVAVAAAPVTRWRRFWQILRAVLRGYCAGQPVNDGRPRKGCC